MGKIDFSGRVALVTGASSGIGREMALELARRGSVVLLVARSAERLQELAQAIENAGGKAHVFPCDLSDPTATAELPGRVAAAGYAVDYLVNNAGGGRTGALFSEGEKALGAMLDVNVRALTMLTRAFLPGMLTRERGGILLVASMLAYFPMPKMAAYAASKAYVRAFGEALSVELRKTNVHVTILSPGNVPTGFQKAAGFGEKALPVPGSLDAARVARLAIDGFARRSREILPGPVNRLTRTLVSAVPNRALARLAVAVLEKLGRF